MAPPGHSVLAFRPRTSKLVRMVATLALGAGCVGLTVVQRSRVVTVGRLLTERERLLGQLIEVERRERRLSEQLHDEALQYVLAARMDLEDVRDRLSPDALGRIDFALSRASAFLRATISELRPAVLEQWTQPATRA